MLSAIVVLLLQRSAPVDISIKVDGVERTALLYPASASRNLVPTVFMFHGFTGNARQASFSARIQDEWPEANVVYPQGLEVSLLGRKGPGWQIAPRTQGDRDVRFYDALLAKLKSDYHSDSKLIYSCGMAAVFKHIPVYYPNDVGAVGGIVGVIGGLGGFVCPILFGYLLKLVGLWTSCWLFFAVVALICVIWMHIVVLKMGKSIDDQGHEAALSHSESHA